MICRTVRLPDGTVAIACGSKPRKKRCAFCGQPCDLLCDWKLAPTKAEFKPPTTCDKPICARCALHIGDDKDICPEHREAAEAWLAQHPEWRTA